VFFWIGLAVALVVAALVFARGARGQKERAHQPGTRRLR
jgi:cytochrome oxidase assembly protein ShyY1